MKIEKKVLKVLDVVYYACLAVLMIFAIFCFSRTCSAKAAEPAVPQVRAGLHGAIPLGPQKPIKLAAHVILADLVQGGDTFAYAGPHFVLGPTTKMEVMFGGSFKKADHSPIISPRLYVHLFF